MKSITDLITIPAVVNLDFSDVRTTMSRAGMAIMGIGVSNGENRALEAAERAFSHPLLEDVNISGAKGVIVGITAGSNLTMEEAIEASQRVHDEVGPDADIIWGMRIDESMGVTVIATGIGDEEKTVSLASARGIADPTYGGKVRDITAADIAHSGDLEMPTFIRLKKTSPPGRVLNRTRGFPLFRRMITIWIFRPFCAGGQIDRAACNVRRAGESVAASHFLPLP